MSKVKEKFLSLKKFEIDHVPRSENRQVDALSKLARSSPNGHPKSIQWEILCQPTVASKVIAWVDRSETWMNPLIDYLCDGTLP